jgi:hypothetical protein
MGLLRVTGSIDLSQFWPAGDSDADTTKVVVSVDAGSFRFRAGVSGAFKVTKVFRNTKVVDRVTKAPIDAKGRGHDHGGLHPWCIFEFRAAQREALAAALPTWLLRCDPLAPATAVASRAVLPFPDT